MDSDEEDEPQPMPSVAARTSRFESEDKRGSSFSQDEPSGQRRIVRKSLTKSLGAAHTEKRTSLTPFLELDKVETKLKKERDGVEESQKEDRQNRAEIGNLVDMLRALRDNAAEAQSQEPKSSEASLKDIVGELERLPGVEDAPDADEPLLVYAGAVPRRSVASVTSAGPRESIVGGVKVKAKRDSWILGGSDDTSTSASDRKRTSEGELESTEPRRGPRDADRMVTPVAAPVDDPVPMPAPLDSPRSGVRDTELTEAGAGGLTPRSGAASFAGIPSPRWSTATPGSNVAAAARSVSRGPEMMASFFRTLSGSFEGSFSGVWEPDAPNCSICRARFIWRRRRHHCRKCGRCVCKSCSPCRVFLARPLVPSERQHLRTASFVSREPECRGAASFMSASSFRMPAVVEAKVQGEPFAGTVLPEQTALFSAHHGFISQGEDLMVKTMSVEEAKVACAKLVGCRGFTFKGGLTDGKVEIHFKSKWNIQGDGWTSFCYEPIKASTVKHGGYISAGGDLEKDMMTIEQATARCEELADRGCRGFTFEGDTPEPEVPVMIYFKSKWDLHGTGWTSYRFRPLERYVLDNSRFFLGLSPGPGTSWYSTPSVDDADDSIAGLEWGDVVNGRLVDEDWLQVGDRYLPMRIRGVAILVRVPDGAHPAPQQTQAHRICVWCQGPFVTAAPTTRASFS